ncbi:MAG: SPOR domain-containing protein [Pseudomonadota bacterium]
MPLIAGLTINELGSATSILSTLITGKGFGEHVLDLATGEDCRLLETALRDDRKFCEPHGSAATAKDFKGLASLLGPPPATTEAALAAVPAPSSEPQDAAAEVPGELEAAAILAASAAEAPVQPIAPAARKSTAFAIQIASFREPDNARGLALRLRQAGYDTAVVVNTDARQRTWNVVRIGGFEDVRSAEAVAARLASQHKTQPVVVRANL